MIKLGECRPMTVNHEQTAHDHSWPRTVYSLSMLQFQLRFSWLADPCRTHRRGIQRMHPTQRAPSLPAVRAVMVRLVRSHPRHPPTGAMQACELLKQLVLISQASPCSCSKILADETCDVRPRVRSTGHAPDVHLAQALLAHGLVYEAVRMALHAQRRRRHR